MREVLLDGRPAAIGDLLDALRAALDGGEPVLPLDAHHPHLNELRAAMTPRRPLDPSVALVVTTTGSTGAPKGVLLTASALRASATATHTRLGGPGRWLLATPAMYIGGIQVLIRSLLAGHTPSVVDLGDGFRPAAFAAAASDVLADDGPRYTALVPAQLHRIVDAGGAACDALRAFDAVIIGAAALPVELRERAETVGVRVISAYGMSETASGCVYDGVPLDGVDLRLNPLPGNDFSTPGQIDIAGPVLASGYLNNPNGTALAFVDGWFRTGDLGVWAANGRMETIGRADDMINTGGVKIAPALVERALSTHPLVAEVCVLGMPDDQWGQAVTAVIVPIDPSSPLPRGELAELVRNTIGRAAVPKRFAVLPALPTKGPGKIDRAAVFDRLSSSEDSTD